MQCPDCQAELNPINLKNRRMHLSFDVCPQCAGAWIDSFSVNYLSLKDLKQIKAQSKNIVSNRLSSLCPECKKPLQKIGGENIPSDVNVLSCTQCKKYWFTYKDLAKFKDAQKAKLNYFQHWKIPLQTVFSILLPIIIIVPLSLIIFRPQTPEIYWQNSLNNIQLLERSENRLNDRELEISFRTNFETTAEIEYGKDANHLISKTISPSPALAHKTVLLLANDTYYRLILDNHKSHFISQFFFVSKNK